MSLFKIKLKKCQHQSMFKQRCQDFSFLQCHLPKISFLTVKTSINIKLSALSNKDDLRTTVQSPLKHNKLTTEKTGWSKTLH